ncbi:MAG: hypothetical protein N3A57_04165 [Negativicutes bacterium]|nr:hypothetical protein [Negativicutes bacterium]
MRLRRSVWFRQIKIAYKRRSFWQGLRLFVLVVILLSLLLIVGEQLAWIFGHWLVSG